MHNKFDAEDGLQ